MASNIMDCDYCGVKFTDLPELLDHEEIHRALAFLNGDVVEPRVDHFSEENMEKSGVCEPPELLMEEEALTDEPKELPTEVMKVTPTFPCSECNHRFTTKQALVLHVKSKHSGIIHKCFKCNKVFVYVGNKNCHEKSWQGKVHVRDICEKRCSMTGGLERHREVHKKPPKPQTRPPKRKTKASSASASKKPKCDSSSCYRCRRCDATFPDRHQLYLHGMQDHYQVGGGLQQRPWDVAPWESEDGTIDEDLKEVYAANEPLILEEDRPGPIQSTYNFPVGNDVSVARLNGFAEEIYDREQRAFKLNLSFGVILRHRESGQYRYFTPYVNNTVFDSPIYISKRTDLRCFYLRLRRLDLLDQLLRNRPDTKWIPVLVTNVMFYVTSSNYPVGHGDLPDYLLNKLSLYPLIKN